MFHNRFKRYTLYILICSFCVIVLINEFIIYSLYRFSWTSIPCSANCTSILFVADPQIIGETFDSNVYNSLAIIDSDRDLRNTFSRAFAFSKPDVVCFMGDLMDEGSVASETEYNRYVKRFKSIFRTNPKTDLMHIPGDNDIGGERDDHVTTFKTNRFRMAFNESSTLIIKNRLRFLNINLLTHTYPKLTDNEAPNQFINILLTHMSILTYPGFSMKTIFDKFKPNMIFSAHMHLSRILTYPPQNIESLNDNRIISVDMESRKTDEYSKFTEIMVPTCSYRMGVFSIGYGLAIIENNVFRYTVLWSPNRFVSLGIYAGWLIIVLFTLVIWVGCKNFYFCKRRVTYRFRQRLMIATDKF